MSQESPRIIIWEKSNCPKDMLAAYEIAEVVDDGTKKIKIKNSLRAFETIQYQRQYAGLNPQTQEPMYKTVPHTSFMFFVDEYFTDADESELIRTNIAKVRELDPEEELYDNYLAAIVGQKKAREEKILKKAEIEARQKAQRDLQEKSANRSQRRIKKKTKKKTKSVRH